MNTSDFKGYTLRNLFLCAPGSQSLVVIVDGVTMGNVCAARCFDSFWWLCVQKFPCHVLISLHTPPTGSIPKLGTVT